MNRIIYVFKSGLNFGAGHASRAKFISEYIKKEIKNVDFLFAVQDKSEVYKDFVSEAENFNTDEEIINFLKVNKPEFIILDRRINSKEMIIKCNKIAKTIVIEDENVKGAEVFIVWDSNKKNSTKNLKNEFYGFENVLVNPEILKFRKKSINRKVEKIFMCMGGTDVNSVIPWLVQNLSLRFEIVVLPGIHYKEYLNLMSCNVKILNSSNFSWKEIADCDFGLVSGGIIMSEALSLFLPLVVWPQVEHQYYNAVNLEQKEFAVIEKRKEKILNVVNLFADDYISRSRLYNNLKKSDYGHGINKLVKYLEVKDE